MLGVVVAVFSSVKDEKQREEEEEEDSSEREVHVEGTALALLLTIEAIDHDLRCLVCPRLGTAGLGGRGGGGELNR